MAVELALSLVESADSSYALTPRTACPPTAATYATPCVSRRPFVNLRRCDAAGEQHPCGWYSMRQTEH